MPTKPGEERESEAAAAQADAALPADPPGDARGAGSGVVGGETGEGSAAPVTTEAGGSAPDSRLTRVAMLLPVIGAPAGLMFAIFASLMISGWHVEHSAIVQVDTLWRPGERVAMRVHVQNGDGNGVPDATVQASLVRGEQTLALAELVDVTGGGATQGTFEVPAWAPGPAELVLAIQGGKQKFSETVPVRLDPAPEARRGTVMVSSSIKNWADDTEPQPERLRIALRPIGRLAAGFENALLVRVTDPEGVPHVGAVEVRLLDGEFGEVRADSAAPPVVFHGTTDAQGLLRFDGVLSTDVVRFEVRVAAPVREPCSKCAAGDTAVGHAMRMQAAEAAKAGAGTAVATGTTATGTVGATGTTTSMPATDATDATVAASATGTTAAGPAGPLAPPEPLGTRRFRLVSFAGAVRVTAEPLALRVGPTLESALELRPRALRAKKAVFIDLHGPDGAWIDTLTPVTGPEPPRVWSARGLAPGFLQIEAYQFTTSPGESAALARVQLTQGDPDSDAALAPLFVEQRALLAVGRVEKGFDRELERKYLDVIEKAEVAASDVPLARAWLLGTLPVEVLGPPLALSSLPREQADVAARKQRWANGLRWFLLGGGGVFLLVTLLLIVISHRRAAARLTGEIHGEGATAAIAHEIRQAQRAVLLRAIGLVLTMAMGLVLTVVVLDKLLWNT